MIDNGSGKMDELLDCLYNHYEVICLTEDFEPLLKKDFVYRVILGYTYYVDNIDILSRDGNVVRVNLHRIDDVDILWLEMSGPVEGVERVIVRKKEGK